MLSEALGVQIQKHGSNVQVVGVDPSYESISVAEHHLPKQLKGIVSYVPDTIENYAQLNKNAGKFDTIVMSEVIEHVENPLDFIKTSLTLLKVS